MQWSSAACSEEVDPMLTRRGFLETMLAAGAGIPALKDDGLERLLGLARRVDGRLPAEVARDEDFWLGIQQAFTLDRTLINLNNGGVSPSPRVVQEAMRRYLEYANTAPVYTMWQVLEPEIESVRRRLAASVGCDPEEMAITRNASEALEIVQLGLPLERGDEVLTTTQDYPRMLTTWHQRERREGIMVKEISFPVPPPSQDDLGDRIERAITPKTRVIYVCHITNLTGQIFPVKRICQLGRARGIEVIVDGAHAYAHFPFTRDELDCDYYGTSLHKWLLAPHGTGFLYVRKAKIERVWPMMAAPRGEPQRHRRGAHLSRGDRSRAQGRPAALPVPALGEAAREAAEGEDPHALRSGTVVRARQRGGRGGGREQAGRLPMGQVPHHRDPHRAQGVLVRARDAERVHDYGRDRPVRRCDGRGDQEGAARLTSWRNAGSRFMGSPRSRAASSRTAPATRRGRAARSARRDTGRD